MKSLPKEPHSKQWLRCWKIKTEPRLKDIERRLDDLTQWQGQNLSMFQSVARAQTYILVTLFLAQASLLFLFRRILKLESVAE